MGLLSYVLVVDFSHNPHIKLLHTPVGTFLKQSSPLYFAKKIPNGTKVEKNGNIYKFYFSKNFWKKNKQMWKIFNGFLLIENI